MARIRLQMTKGLLVLQRKKLKNHKIEIFRKLNLNKLNF